MLHTFIDILRNSILITGLVVVMMMMIESMNIESKGLFFKGLRKTKTGQVVFSALLGSIPGCMGGFAAVSLYTHRMFSFGALVAMMIASSGDEAFVMLAMIPEKALIIFLILFVLAIVVGIITDKVYDRIHEKKCGLHDHEDCGVHADCDGYIVHENEEIATSDCHHHHNDAEEATCTCHPAESHNPRHFSWKRISMLVGLALFIAALGTGQLGHNHSAHATHATHDHGHNHDHSAIEGHEHGIIEGHDHSAIEGHDHEHEGCHCEEHSDLAISGHTINLLNEEWMNILFAGLSIIMLFVLLLGSDHFVEEHLWNHIVKKHLPTIFAWTFGVLLVLGIALQYVAIDHWISDNTALMILLATLIGIIPESGPHMIFVTLFAAGVVPFPVLLASSISQDGHAGIPLLAESKMSFAWAKLINCVVAIAAGFAAMLFM